MSLSRKHLAAILLAATAACADSPMEPGRLYPVPAIEPRFVMPPGVTPASFGLEIDTVEIMVSQYDTTQCDCQAPTPGRRLSPSRIRAMVDTSYIDSLIPWPSNQESFSFRYEVAPPDPGFGIQVYVAFWSKGAVLFYGYADVDFRRGSIALPPIFMYYTGPGSNADDIQLAPGDTAMAVGDTLQFAATAYNNALPLDTVYLSWRVSDSTVAKIDHTGRLTLRNGALGSSFLVSASIPTGVTTSTRVSVPNTVAQLVKVSGDSQSAPLGEPTSAPLIVRAVDGSGKPVAGARVRFAPVGGAAAFRDSIIFTDPLGLARSAPIPDSLVAGAVQAGVTGTALTVGFTVTGTSPLSRPFLFTADSGVGGIQLYRADSNGGNRVLIGYPQAAYTFAAPRWNPARNRVAYTSYNANAGIYQLLLTTANGDTTAVLVADSNSTGARFSPTGKMIAFVCHGLVYDVYNPGGVCTVNAVDGVLGALNGAGNGAGRTDLSTLVPGRPNGPPAFAWRSDASTRIAFVRDTILDSLSLRVASRIYSVNGDGTTLTTLSPLVTDLGHGPLRIEGTIDWSPDGSTIVFTAQDTVSYEASLYALTVTTGAVRKLTTPPINWMGDFYPKFSPDGQRILFQRIDYYYCCGMVTDFYTVRVVGGSPTRITYEGANWPGNNPDAYHLGGDWSPGGGSVVVTAENTLGWRAAYRVPTDVTSQADYLARRVLVGTAGISGLTDFQVSWLP